MAKTAKPERVRKINLQTIRIATALIRLDRKIESYLGDKATEIEAFTEHLEVVLTPEPEAPSAN
jgi:hypothetical protein